MIWIANEYVVLSVLLALLAVSVYEAGRRQRVSRSLAVAIASMFWVVPIVSIRGGMASAIYMSDLLAVPLAISYVIGNRIRPRVDGWALLAAMVLIPAMTTSVLFALEMTTVGQATFLHLFRHTGYICLYLWMRDVGSSAISIIKTFVAGIILLSLVGALHYFGPADLDVFNHLAYNRVTLAVPRLGTGFGGLFRGTVGHMFALLAILAFSLVFDQRGRWRVVGVVAWLLCASMIYSSYSRAGAVGMAVGSLIVVGFAGRHIARRGLIAILAGIALLVTWMALPDAVAMQIRTRFDPTYGMSLGYQDDAYWTRRDSIRTSIGLFMHDSAKLWLGTGAARDEAIAEAIGTWGAHNEFVQIVYTGGLLSLVAFGIFLGTTARGIVVRKGAMRAGDVAAAFGVLSANVVIALPQSAYLGSYATHLSIIVSYAVTGVVMAPFALPAARSRTSTAEPIRPTAFAVCEKPR